MHSIGKRRKNVKTGKSKTEDRERKSPTKVINSYIQYFYYLLTYQIDVIE